MATAKNAAAARVLIGCRLPHGLIIEHPTNANIKVEIQGLNKSRIIGAPFVTTEVDGELWQAWKMFNADFPAVKSGAIFEAGSIASLEAAAKEVEKEKTGFEQMPQEAQGVKPADKE
jgi:hypothetical protein